MSIGSNTEVPTQILEISVYLNIICMLFNGPEEVIQAYTPNRYSIILENFLSFILK